VALRRRPGAASLMVAATAGLLAATPVDVSWDDGCNAHGGRAPIAVAPLIEQRKPESAPLAYEDVSTLMLRVRRRR
jgi:hypothetical protein